MERRRGAARCALRAAGNRMEGTLEHKTLLLYRYGPVAWVWRALGALALGGGALLGVAALRLGEWWLVALALPLVVPVLVLFPMVAVRIELRDAVLDVATLACVRRRVPRDRIAGHSYRETAAGELTDLYAPRVWVRVRGGLPIHVDLMGRVPDPAALAAALGLPRKLVPRRDSTQSS